MTNVTDFTAHVLYSDIYCFKSSLKSLVYFKCILVYDVWLPLTRPLLGAQPANQACALAGNPTCDPLVCRLALSLLSHSRALILSVFLYMM